MARPYIRTKEYKGIEYKLQRNDCDFSGTHRVIMSDGIESPWYTKMRHAIEFAEWSIDRDIS